LKPKRDTGLPRESDGTHPAAGGTESSLSESVPEHSVISEQQWMLPIEPLQGAPLAGDLTPTTVEQEPSNTSSENPISTFFSRIISESIEKIRPANVDADWDDRSLKKIVERATLPAKVSELELENKRIRRKLRQQKKNVKQRLKSLKRKKQKNPRTATNTFKHSGDYRWVRIRKQQYRLTSMQAQVIGILHKAYIEDKPELGMDSILTEIDARSSRLRDIFRSRPGSWRDLVRKTSVVHPSKTGHLH